ncbi:MAG: hypothetical protein L3J69_17115 [Desulfobacula sp.]|nr:hypothetical protein [Desulfobacula sp.]
MKKQITLIILAFFLAAASTVWAANDKPNDDTIKMQSTIYGATIDSKVAFYQKRLYLIDSEYKILANIGKDAVKRIAYLKSNRQQLISNMTAQNVDLTNTRMDSYLGKTMNSVNLTTMEAYSSDN